jgi:acetyl esterase
MTANTTTVVLEPAAEQFAAATADPPYVFDLGPEKGREVIDELLVEPVEKPAADVEDLRVPGGSNGDLSVRIVRPQDATGALPIIFYIHGDG